MSEKIKQMIEKIESMQAALSDEIEKESQKIAYELRNGTVVFDASLLAKQKAHMKDLRQWFAEVPMVQFFAAPIIYGMVIPAILLDIALLFYRYPVSWIFKIPFAKRSDYIIFDRQYLGYLNIMEKFNCVYCSYFNGLMQYAAAIAGATELYFCPIKHARKTAYRPPFSEKYFAYGDGETYRKNLKNLKETLVEG